MIKIPASFHSVTATILHIIGIPVFFIGFVLIYESQWMLRYTDIGPGSTINTLLLASILIGGETISRITMLFIEQRNRMNWWQYTFWTLGEIFVFSCFAALYMALLYGDLGYFPALGECLRMSFATISYPYINFALLIAVIKPDEDKVAEEDLVRFADSTGRLKLVIAHDVILYIEAQENYVSVHYMEGTTHKEYSLRQSMRGIEDLMDKHGIIRCQRSYFVNPRHVKVLRRDKEGMIQAELDVLNSKPVPVSPKYYEQLSKML